MVFVLSAALFIFREAKILEGKEKENGLTAEARRFIL